MNLIELRQTLENKQYPQGFIEDVIIFYPMMIQYYGEQEVDNFLREWIYVFYNKLGASGNTEREKKQVNVNLYSAEEYWDERLITALFHELGHALGTLEMPVDDLLSQGHDRESFFVKMDEAVVSDYQDDIMFGQLQYGYYESQINFKCRGGKNNWHKYPFEKLYYNVLKILLGDKQDLIIKLMHEKNVDTKIQIYKTIISELKNNLTEEELGILLDSCVILELNHGYGEVLNQTMANQKINNYLREDYIYNKQQQKTEEEIQQFEIEFKKYVSDFYSRYWKKSVDYATSRKIAGTNIFEQSDKLCSMVVDYLIRKLQSSESFDFSTIKAICEYLVKINNKSVDAEKMNILINSLFSYLNKLDISFDEEIEQMFSHQELLGVIAKIIALNRFNIDMLNTMSIVKSMEDGTVYLKCGNSIIKLSRQNTNVESYDTCLGTIEVNTVLPQVKLSLYDKTIGDANISSDLVDENRLLCQINLESLKSK